MTANLCTDIAALIHPLPSPPGDLDDDDGFYATTVQVQEERDETAEALDAAWDAGDVDPLLATLEHLRQKRLELETQMRQLIAYGRRFTHPRPYKLIDLATAAGMSISGVRTAYEAEEIEQVSDILGRSPSIPAPSASDRP